MPIRDRVNQDSPCDPCELAEPGCRDRARAKWRNRRRGDRTADRGAAAPRNAAEGCERALSMRRGDAYSPLLHGFSKLLAGWTILLILAGSLVTSHGAGLSVP